MTIIDQATSAAAPPQRPRAGNHKARAREASIERILDAAEQLFAEFGYHGVTLKDVAARVGVSSTLLHYHFTGKESIYEAVWDDRYDGVSNTLEVHVKELRRKLEAGGGPRLIHTLRGRGYRFGTAETGGDE